MKDFKFYTFMSAIEKMLRNEVEKQFKAKLVINNLLSQAKEAAERSVWNKYRGTIIYRNGMEYQFWGVTSNFYINSDSPIVEEIDIKIFFFCISKMPKRKRVAMVDAKKYCDKYHSLKHTNHKIPLAVQLNFDISVNNAFTGSYSLDIRKGDIRFDL